MKKSSLISALGIGILSIGMAFAAPADAVNQIRQNATQVLSILKSGDANTARQ
ncbi:TPA: transporter, partial [Neisseria meningitidis]